MKHSYRKPARSARLVKKTKQRAEMHTIVGPVICKLIETQGVRAGELTTMVLGHNGKCTIRWVAP